MGLKTAGVENGTMVFALYSGERSVHPAYQKSKFEERLFGMQLVGSWWEADWMDV